MEEIIKKRTELSNYFYNENKTYTKEAILHKEFAVLSFSPHEEYIDTVKSKYDNLCVDLSTFVFEDMDECYIKGVISDVDRQRIQTIIHLQNKDNNVSVTIRPSLLEIYNDYLIVGEPTIVKCNIWKNRAYLSFLISLNYLDNFKQEQEYMDGNLEKWVKKKNKINKGGPYKYGLIMQCNLIKTKRGKKMIRGILHDGTYISSFGCMLTFNPLIDESLRASDVIKYRQNDDEEFFISSSEKVPV